MQIFFNNYPSSEYPSTLPTMKSHPKFSNHQLRLAISYIYVPLMKFSDLLRRKRCIPCGFRGQIPANAVSAMSMNTNWLLLRISSAGRPLNCSGISSDTFDQPTPPMSSKFKRHFCWLPTSSTSPSSQDQPLPTHRSPPSIFLLASTKKFDTVFPKFWSSRLNSTPFFQNLTISPQFDTVFPKFW